MAIELFTINKNCQLPVKKGNPGNEKTVMLNIMRYQNVPYLYTHEINVYPNILKFHWQGDIYSRINTVKLKTSKFVGK